MRPSSVIITAAGQTIEVAEDMSFVQEEVNIAIQEWRLVVLTQIKFTRVHGTWGETEKWETRTLMFNPDHIVTVWPVDGWITHKESGD